MAPEQIYLVFMTVRYLSLVIVIAFVSIPPLAECQGDKAGNDDAAGAARGKSAFRSSCGFCHGEDATGARAPDLVRSAILSHDEQGSLIIPVIKNGRPDKGMPAFSTLKDSQIADIVAFLHHQAEAARNSADVPGDYPLAKMLTGNAAAGKAYFEGAGGCTACHSVSKDLAGVANRYKPVDLQQRIVYPSRDETDIRTAVVTTADGQHYAGKLRNFDEFNIGIICQDGWFRSWPLDQVKVEVKDPLETHRDLMSKYTDADIHNLFAYLESLK